MSLRFFLETPASGPSARLTGQQAHHLLNVMRIGVGGEVTLFDGSGWELRAKVTRAGRADVDLEILSREQVDLELPFSLTLGVALPKGERQRWLVEKLVELGASRLVPLLSERGVAKPAASTVKRLRRTVVEASKQCGRTRLMQIDDPQPVDDYLRGGAEDSLRLLAHPGGGDLLHPEKIAQPVFVAVGPEGGFTQKEARLADEHGWLAVALGPRTLRVETAAVALAALFALPSRRG